MTSDQATARGGAVPAPRVALGAAIPGRPFPLGVTRSLRPRSVRESQVAPGSALRVWRAPP
jgi:hypothetical protein